MRKYDFLIVGAGLYGLVLNYIATKKGYKCLIIERRSTIGGNLYTEVIDDIPIHKYGAHIFHTDNKEIWDFVCSLCEMVPFINSPMAVYKNEIYNLPFNMNTFSKLFSVITPDEAKNIISNEIKAANIINPANLEEQAISLVGTTIYTKLIKEYTEKQWGRSCNELSADIINRIPVRYTYNNNYFNDTYQGIPAGGYTEFITNLKGKTEVILNTDYDEHKNELNKLAKRIIYTGPIDKYFNYTFGKLDWRSVEFKTKKLDVPSFQANAVVNYTSHDKPYTRIIEHKYFDKKASNISTHTIISEEYPTECNTYTEPFYPVNNDKNNKLLTQYQNLSTDVFFGGRLGTYRYYDMDDTIINVFNDFKFLHN